MRTILLAVATLAFLGSTSVSAQTWTYEDCKNKCRQTIPPGVTVKQCAQLNNCAQYPKRKKTSQSGETRYCKAICMPG